MSWCKYDLQHIFKIFLMSKNLRIVSRCLMVGDREEPLLLTISFLSHFLTETWSIDVPNRREKLWVYILYIAEEIQKFGALSKATIAFAECIESLIEDQAFSLSYDLATPPPHPPSPRQQVFSLSLSSCMSPVELPDGRGAWKGGGRSQIIRRSESLVLCKP